MATGSYTSATLTVDGNRSVTFADAGNNGSNVATNSSTGSITLTNGGKLNVGGNLWIGSNSTSQGAVSVSGLSQLNVGGDLGLGGQGTYAFGLASTPTNGAVSFGGNLWIACGGQNNVSLTVNSGAPASNYTGVLSIAGGSYTSSDQGTLTVNGNRTLSFAGGCNLATDFGTSTANALATLNLTNGAKLDFGGNLTVGSQYWNGSYDQYSSASINVDGSSQLNAAGSLYLRGVGTYNLQLAATPANGKLSFRGDLNVADTYYDYVSLTVVGGPATPFYSNANVNVATGPSTHGYVTLGPGTTMDLGGNGVFAQNGVATLTLQNGAYLGFFNDSHLRYNATTAATLQGTGTFDGGNQFYMNGRVVATGGPLDVDFGTLCSDGYSLTQGDGSQAGWYATSGGDVVLKTIPIASGTNAVTWGEQPGVLALRRATW